jgi:hypothetical protein
MKDHGSVLYGVADQTWNVSISLQCGALSTRRLFISYHMPISHVRLVIRQLLLRERTLRAVAMLLSTNALNTGRLRFSGVLLGVGRRLVTDVSGQPVGPIFKGPAVQEQPR